MIQVFTALADNLTLEMWRSTFSRNELVVTDDDIQFAKSWERGVLRQIHFRQGAVETLLSLLQSLRPKPNGDSISIDQQHLLGILKPQLFEYYKPRTPEGVYGRMLAKFNKVIEIDTARFLYRENVYRIMYNLMHKCLLITHRDPLDEFWLNLFFRTVEPGNTPNIWESPPRYWLWPDLLPLPVSRDDAFAQDLHKFIALPLAAIVPQMVIYKWPHDSIFGAFSRIFTWRRANRQKGGPTWLSQQNRLTPKELVQSHKWEKAWCDVQTKYNLNTDERQFDIIDTLGALIAEDQGRFAG